MKSVLAPDILTGKIALVTGGGSGIGAACVRALAGAGAQVVIASRNAERIAAAEAGLRAEFGPVIFGMTCNIRDRASVKALVERIHIELGPLDILVNNGGGQYMAPAATISPKGWDAVVQTNLTGTWNLTQEVATSGMLERGGRIINITMLTDRGFPGMAHSAAARSGVEALTKTLAVEWAPFDVQINCIQPGIILSSGLGTYPHWRDMVQGMREQIPSKKLGTPWDIGQIVGFLASPAGGYITGQVWAVDGGRNLWGNGWPIDDPDEYPPLEIPREPWE